MARAMARALAVSRAWTRGAATAATATRTALGSGIDFKKRVVGDETPSAFHARLVREGVARADDAQAMALEVLDDVYARARAARAASGVMAETTAWRTLAGWLRAETTRRTADERDRGRGGAYVHGGPGSGKTFVMDLFYATLEGKDGVEKRREHFHSFMIDTHTRLHKLKDSGSSSDTVRVYAKELARETRVLCLDEFQIVDVADAMIIRRLLENLWEEGVLLVTTSNRHPDELYKNGLNRSQFLPCIDEIKHRCIVHEMASERDYRLTGARGGDNHVTWKSGGDESERELWLMERLKTLAGERQLKPLQIAISGRIVHVRRAGGGIAHFDFQELCDSALGAADYTALASIFNTIGVGHVPILGADRFDLVRRFITFVDVMYEHKVKVFISAAASPQTMYRSSDATATSSRKDAARDEEFAWDRTVSRLMEMQTKEFQEAAWNPKAGSWLLEQARVTEVLPAQVLRSLWQRYDRNRDNVLDETELEDLIADLNHLRSGHRHVSEEQLDAVMSIVSRQSEKQNRYITRDEFELYGHRAMLECMRDR